MKVSLEWLREYAALDAPLDALVVGLIETGTEVDDVQRGPAGVVVARIAHLAPVPESTRGVRFADIDIGTGRLVGVLTGAPNLGVGDLVPYAPPGTQLPGMDAPLGVRAMFGGKYESPGMLCSAAELGVGEDADGILILESGTPGQPLHEVVQLDTVLDVEVTTNRPDCLCHLGIAREAAAAIGESVRDVDTAIADELLSAASLQNRVDVDVQDAGGCPRFAVLLVENVTVGPSPPWLQRRLRAVGLRPINNVVDVTNYVARELGQPLHAFDLDRFLAAQGEGDGIAHVVVRRGRGEALRCLDGVERMAGPEDLVVCANEHPASFAGVMGGEPTAVHAGTRHVLLEGASWEGTAIRATSRRLQLRTDASTLYEKGLSDTLPPLALARAAALIAELGGGHVLRDSVDVRARPLPPIPAIEVTGRQVSALLGMEVDATEAATCLARLQFGVEQDGDRLRVTVPHFRRDVTMLADVVEEVGRSLGYDRIPSRLPSRAVAASGAPEVPLDERVRDLLIGAGFDEAITWSFVSVALAARLAGIGAGREMLAIQNPLSDEWTHLRTSLLPGVVNALAANVRHGNDGVRLFEVGRAFWPGERRGAMAGATPDGADADLPPLPAEPLILAAAMSAESADEAAAAVRHLQAVIARLTVDLGGVALSTRPAAVAPLRPGRAAQLLVGDTVVGMVGELAAPALEGFDLRARVAVAEVQVDALVPAERPPRRYRAPSRHPAVVQDLAVTVAENVPAGEGLRVVRESGGTLLTAAVLYDEYRGSAVGPGRKGWTFRLTFRAPDRTLTSEEAATVQDGIAIGLRQRLGAEVRSSVA
ncbi:MAG: phenylalanine--tRNA ligase subunit beta [Candidatus Dormibacteria bacterium]